MNQSAPLAPTPAGNRGIQLLLHLCVLVCTAIASPIVGLMALTMALIFVGHATTKGAQYVGGGTGILLFVIFVLTPVCATLHCVGLIFLGLRRSTRAIWVITAIYVALVWIACLVGPDASLSQADLLKGRSLRPFYLLLAIPTIATLVAVFIHALAARRKTENTRPVGLRT